MACLVYCSILSFVGSGIGVSCVLVCICGNMLNVSFMCISLLSGRIFDLSTDIVGMWYPS